MIQRRSPLGRALDRIEVAELRSDLTALAHRVGQLAEQVAVLNERSAATLKAIEERDDDVAAMAKRVERIERAAILRSGKLAAYVLIGTAVLWLLANIGNIVSAIRLAVKL
jgi:chromosome segregation ATPase